MLLEDVPGVGKTTLAKALAESVNADYNRIPFTPDLLPADILGSSIFNPQTGQFTFRKGPIFTNILLADEINRASPRTQSALLEAMTERQATIEGVCHPIDAPFIVIATQNPIEYHMSSKFSMPSATSILWSKSVLLPTVRRCSKSRVKSARSALNVPLTNTSSSC